ncbi:hypothetical protein PoB_003451300 [Plakobranchus ocellatus]|uniref:Ig-like domain-containing protein n=1 Tax=Plakobranchus ocellatus TaxID=259542 RepID=A0AAV4AN53_9GAST|nr:hypothetical protein PoB_003451300 [Plakobranchus ocellatus]
MEKCLATLELKYEDTSVRAQCKLEFPVMRFDTLTAGMQALLPSLKGGVNILTFKGYAPTNSTRLRTHETLDPRWQPFYENGTGNASLAAVNLGWISVVFGYIVDSVSCKDDIRLRCWCEIEGQREKAWSNIDQIKGPVEPHVVIPITTPIKDEWGGGIVDETFAGAICEGREYSDSRGSLQWYIYRNGTVEKATGSRGAFVFWETVKKISRKQHLVHDPNFNHMFYLVFRLSPFSSLQMNTLLLPPFINPLRFTSKVVDYLESKCSHRHLRSALSVKVSRLDKVIELECRLTNSTPSVRQKSIPNEEYTATTGSIVVLAPVEEDYTSVTVEGSHLLKCSTAATPPITYTWVAEGKESLKLNQSVGFKTGYLELLKLPKHVNKAGDFL